MRLLFVCTGNTCRSPMAAALASHIFGSDIVVESAGIDAFEGETASPPAVAVMERRGIDLSGHSARRLTMEMIEEADMIVTMTTAQQALVMRLNPESADKIYLLSEIAVLEDMAVNISDPWGGGMERYEECAALLERCLRSMTPNFGEAEDLGESCAESFEEDLVEDFAGGFEEPFSEDFEPDFEEDVVGSLEEIFVEGFEEDVAGGLAERSFAERLAEDFKADYAEDFLESFEEGLGEIRKDKEGE